MRIKLIAVSVLLASCSMSLPKWATFTPSKVEVQQGNMITSEMREQVKLGMSRAMARSILGTPLVNDPFHTNRWDYVYRLEQKGKLVTQQHMTLYFEGDTLVRIDDSAMPPVLKANSGGLPEK